MKKDLEDRFLEKVYFSTTTGCWLWLAYRTPTGYGLLGRSGKVCKAHRVAYELYRGPITPGLTLDHLCRVRHCVNPWHLDEVSHRENLLRGQGPSATNARKTECIRGHVFDEENTYFYKQRGLQCRACRRCVRASARVKRR